MRCLRKKIRNVDDIGDNNERLFDISSDGNDLYLEIKQKNRIIKVKWKNIEKQIKDFEFVIKS